MILDHSVGLIQRHEMISINGIDITMFILWTIFLYGAMIFFQYYKTVKLRVRIVTVRQKLLRLLEEDRAPRDCRPIWWILDECHWIREGYQICHHSEWEKVLRANSLHSIDEETRAEIYSAYEEILQACSKSGFNLLPRSIATAQW